MNVLRDIHQRPCVKRNGKRGEYPHMNKRPAYNDIFTDFDFDSAIAAFTIAIEKMIEQERLLKIILTVV
jgi:hypothetical protein